VLVGMHAQHAVTVGKTAVGKPNSGYETVGNLLRACVPKLLLQWKKTTTVGPNTVGSHTVAPSGKPAAASHTEAMTHSGAAPSGRQQRAYAINKIQSGLLHNVPVIQRLQTIYCLKPTFQPPVWAAGIYCAHQHVLVGLIVHGHQV
jgi:hypothetical protein